MHNLSRLNSGPPGLPNDQLLGLPGDGVFRPCRFQDLAHLARSDTVTSRLVSVIDDDEALCSSLADLLRSVGYRGYVALEYEAKEDPKTAVPRHIATLKKLLA